VKRQIRIKRACKSTVCVYCQARTDKKPADLFISGQIIRIVTRKRLIDTALNKLPAPIPRPRAHRGRTKERTMKLVYDVIEDGYDDTTQIRTTVYTPHHDSIDVTHI
jgi:hypothetical protein